MNPQAERRVGTVIGGKWRVDSMLGSGSMAAVYAVTHRNGARAALKILHPTLCTDPAVCERFLGEGYLTNSVKHPGIVRVLDDGVTDDGCVFLVMDLLEGDTLEGVRQARGNRIPLVEMLDIADKLMDVLSAVHTAGIIHRDLKPQNVFICNDGTVKLLDFGVARVFDRGSQSKLSMFGLVLGTPSFMSPEQALGSRDKVDHRSDIWSLGATIFTGLTGETVHLGANIQAKLLAAATVKARSITMAMPDLPPPIAAAIDMSLRFKKEDRWQTVDAFRRAIRDARMQLGMGKPQSIVPPAGLDMSDDATQIDHGDIAAAAALARAKMAKQHPAALPDVGFDPSKTQKHVSAPPPPPPGLGATAGGTFIGIGTGEGKMRGVVGHDSSVPPGPLPMGKHPSIPPPPRVPSVAPVASNGNIPPSFPPKTPRISTPDRPWSTAPPAPPPGISVSPAAIVRNPGISIEPRMGSRPDTQEGSIPAYQSSTRIAADSSAELALDAMGVRKKSSIVVWLMAFALAAAAVGGIAFFAVKRGPFAGPEPLPVPPPSAVPTTGTTTTSSNSITPTPPPPMTTTTSPAPPDTRAAAKEADAAVKPSTPPRPTWASGHGVRPPPRPTNTQDPPPGPTNDPKPAPTVPPDPFGTPE